MMLTIKYFATFILALTLTGVLSGATPERSLNDSGIARALEFAGANYFRTELYFGFGKKDGTEVTEEEWSKFLADEVTSRFPDGFTVVSATGQYRGANGTIVREHSRVLILLYSKKDRPQADRKIEAIRTAYCKRFEQESVLRVDMTRTVNVMF
jgi:hypothetical protein